MNITEIEKNVGKLIKSLNEKTFIYDLLLIYNLPKATVTRLQKGTANLSKIPGEISLKNKLFFKEVFDQDLHLTVLEIQKEIKNNQRFIIVTDYRTFLSLDTKLKITLDVHIKNLPKNYDFFLPWAGMEKSQLQNENPADIKAAMKMGILFDQIKNDNQDESQEFLHSLNIFLTRLLFCYFAEDADIFEENQFSNAISSHTQNDGSDLHSYIDKLFDVLNTPENQRHNLPEYLNKFPYVNGGLFSEKSKSPKLSFQSRKLIIENGTLSWSQINPDIFGSMFQAVNHADKRGTLGQHFTSVPNIMKVIEPLFLNDLKEEFENSKGNNKKLNQLLYRLKNIKIFDPACGSGNFLIIAYKELRKLEMEIFKEMGSLALSEISLNQFYGIELDDFAKEIAILALWLTKHQMNVEFFKEFGRANPTLPLRDAGNIVQGNACRLVWEEVCPKSENDEIYILGNPPYLGFQERNKSQKDDVSKVFSEIGNVKRIDYIGCWFKLGADFIENSKVKLAFVSTNSICQGEQVSLLWPYIYSKTKEIFFCHQSFDWGNNATKNAGVTVVIIGIQNKSNSKKYIYSNNISKEVLNISPYLLDGNNTIIYQRNTSVSNFKDAILGSSGIDGGHLLLTPQEKEDIIQSHPNSKQFIRRFVGGGDFLNDKKRYCIWINDDVIKEALKIPPIREKVDSCRKYRESAGRDARKGASVPHRFIYRKHKDTDAIIFPMTSSSRREYLPIGYSTDRSIISNGAFVIYEGTFQLFSILNSKMHNTWMSVTSARMRNDFRYSVNLTYNNFPFPSISNQRKEELIQCTLRIIDERLKHSEKTLAQLYDPDKMPEGLKEAHHHNDLAVERCYRSVPFTSDQERLEYLFKLNKKMIQEEKDKDTLFAKQKKIRKTK